MATTQQSTGDFNRPDGSPCITDVASITDLNLGDDRVVVVVLGLEDEALRQPAVVATGATDLQTLSVWFKWNRRIGMA